MDLIYAKTRKWILTVTLLCLVVSSSSGYAQQTKLATPLEPASEVIDSATTPQPILGQPSSSSSVNQPLTGFNQPSSTGLNQPFLGQPSSNGLNQPILGQPSSSSSLNQPITGFNQPSSNGINQQTSSNSGVNQPFANRLNQNSLNGNGLPFVNGDSKLEVSIANVVFLCIALFLYMN